MDFQLDPLTVDTMASVGRMFLAALMFAVVKHFLWDKR